MLFSNQIKKRNDIRIKPMKSEDGDFLYFPFDYRLGGASYALRNSDVDVAKTIDWEPITFILAPTILLGIFIAMLFDYDVIGSVLGLGLGLWLGVLYYDWNKRRVNYFLSTLKPMPHRMTYRRYWIERSKQRGGVYIATVTFFAIFLSVLFCSTLIFGLRGSFGQQAMVLAMAITLTGYYVYLSYNLLYSRWISRGIKLDDINNLLPQE